MKTARSKSKKSKDFTFRTTQILLELNLADARQMVQDWAAILDYPESCDHFVTILDVLANLYAGINSTHFPQHLFEPIWFPCPACLIHFSLFHHQDGIPSSLVI
jgi:hypothetical protein